jgi:hypothetical protein
MNKKIAIFIFLGLIFTVSCKKQAMNKLNGTWHYYYMSINDTGKTQFWTFKEPDQLLRVIKQNDSVFYDTATWKVDKSFLSPTYLVIDGLEQDNNGTFLILKLNKNFLTLQRTKSKEGSTNGVFSRLEFKKE